MNAGPTHRPLAMLSLGLQVKFTAFDPRPLKAFNLMVHLLNGVLLFLLVRRLAAFLREFRQLDVIGGAGGLALAVSAAWLLSPINLSTVLYVVQRMEIFAFLMTLLGLLGYLRGRRLMLAGERKGVAYCWGSLVVSTFLGSLFKESALLTPLYAFLIEWVVLDFRSIGGGKERKLVWLYAILLGLPLFVGGVWLFLHLSKDYEGRSFTLSERLLTEFRVLWSYVGWILFPRLRSLGFHHDDYAVSRGLLAPLTTLPALVGWILVIVVAMVLRRRQAGLVLGVLLFLAAHLLTATIVPLELVFEHRNYPASPWLWLGLFSVALDRRLPIGEVRVVAVAGLIFLGAGLTAIRAAYWGDPLLFATTTASWHPKSPRANYLVADVLLRYLIKSPHDPRLGIAFTALEKAASLPNSGLIPAQAAVWAIARFGGDDKPWWRMMEKRVQGRLSSADRNALHAIVVCLNKQPKCAYDRKQVGRLLALAQKSHPDDAMLVNMRADYALNSLHDFGLGMKLLQRAVSLQPVNKQFWANLTELFLALKDREKAAYSLERLWELDRHGWSWSRRRRLVARFREVFGVSWKSPYLVR